MYLLQFLSILESLLIILYLKSMIIKLNKTLFNCFKHSLAQHSNQLPTLCLLHITTLSNKSHPNTFLTYLLSFKGSSAVPTTRKLTNTNGNIDKKNYIGILR